MRLTTSVTVLAVALFSIVAAACGGGEEAKPSPTVAPRPTSAPQPTATAVAPPRATAPVPTRAPEPTATSAPAAASTPTAAGPRQPRGKLVVAVANLGTEDIDPITASSASMGLFGGLIFDFAVWHQKDGNLAPGIFERWEQSPDGLKWTFTIRDMKFHNGDPVTAGDIKFDFDRVLTPESNAANSTNWKASLASTDIVSPQVVTVRLKQPWPVFPFFLTPADGSQGAIYPKASFERAGSAKAFFDKPVGTGPFKFNSHETSIRYVFDFSGQPHPYRQQPEFQSVELLAIAEESTRVAMQRTGAADVVAISPDSVPTLQQSGFLILKVPEVNSVSLRLWGLDNLEGLKAFPTADVKVRQALHLAVNRQEIHDTLLGGFATLPVREIVNLGTEGFDPSWKPVPYDPGAARDLLAQAGYARGFTQKLFNVSIPGNPWTPRAGEAVAGYWAAVGVRAEIVPIEYGTWRTYFRESPHVRALGAYGWLFNTKTANSIKTLNSGYHSKDAVHMFKDAEIDASIERALVTLDAQERVRLIRRIVDIVYASYMSIPMANTPELYSAGKTIAGWDPIGAVGGGLSWETLRRK